MIVSFSNRARQAKRTIALTAVLALMQAPFVTPSEARVKVGVTSAVIPEAMMGDNSGRLKTVTVGAKVDQDVLIETGARGRTQVLFIDGSSMNIGPSSRLIIDEFVFDPAQLSGNLGAKLEKGSMRFIGGVLSKRAGQVEFEAGEATVGIRGGIAKIALEADGKMLAQLVHGRISVQTPEGLFETDRIGTQIERAVDGSVATRTLTVEETKTQLDEEAEENKEEKPAEDNIATNETADAPASASQESEASDATEAKEETGDVLVDNPVENGLVEVDAEGNLKASDELAEIDPQAAELIDEGALIVTEDGEIVPTAKILELDPRAQKMFEEGLLVVDENGLLVPNEERTEPAFFNADNFVETEDKTVSDETLVDFGLAAPTELSQEDTYKSNLMMTRATLKKDRTTAKLLEVGQLEIDGESGLLKPSQSFNPLLVARAEQSTSQFESSIVKDDIADRILLSAGVFDTKDTTRVVGAELASNFYSAPVVTLVKRDIVRDDAINAIERLAVSNEVALPDDIKERSLDELVSIGGALSTRDALKASVSTREAEIFLPEIVIGEKGSEEVVKVTVTREAAIALNLPKDETDLTTEVFDDLLSRGIDPRLIIGGIGGTDDGKLDVPGSGVETETYDPGATFTEPVKAEEVEKVDDYESVSDYGRETFVGGISGEFGDEDVWGAAGVETKTEPVIVEPVYEAPGPGDIYVSPEVPEEEVSAVKEDVAEAKIIEVDSNDYFWKLNIAGQRVPVGATEFGDPGPSWTPFYLLWGAYNSSEGANESFITREADNRVFISFDMNTYDTMASYYDDESRRSTGNKFAASSQEPSGALRNLLDFDNYSLNAAVEVLAGYVRSSHISNEPKNQELKFAANDMETMVREARTINSRVSICSDCDQVATGIWQNENFTNESLENITYQHKGHWAIGQPLSSDTLRRLAGMKASFKGHAVGTVITPTLNETGYGTAEINVDFANPKTTSRNTFKLTNFRSENYALENNIPTVGLELDSSTGQYRGQNWADDTVDGALYGTYQDPQNHNLQTAGTFAISRSTTRANEVSISGSFAAKATSISK